MKTLFILLILGASATAGFSQQLAAFHRDQPTRLYATNAVPVIESQTVFVNEFNQPIADLEILDNRMTTEVTGQGEAMAQDPFPEKTAVILDPQAMLLPEIQVFPNPVQDRLTIEILSPQVTNVQLSIVDLNGREFGHLPGALPIGERQRFTMNVSALAAGTYLLRAKGEGFSTATRFVKAK